jgi:hypothetical protein
MALPGFCWCHVHGHGTKFIHVEPALYIHTARPLAIRCDMQCLQDKLMRIEISEVSSDRTHVIPNEGARIDGIEQSAGAARAVLEIRRDH